MPSTPDRMTGRTVLITGGTGGIGKATAIGLAAPRRPRRHRRPRPRPRAGRRGRDQPPIGEPGGGRVRRRPVLSDRGSPARGGRPGHLPAPARAGQQRGRVLGAPAPDRRRPGTHLRRQPPRALPAHRPAARSAQGRRPGPDRHRLLQRTGPGPHRLRRPAGRNQLFGAASLQPVQARQRAVHLRACPSPARHRGDRQRAAPGGGAHRLRRRGPLDPHQARPAVDAGS